MKMMVIMRRMIRNFEDRLYRSDDGRRMIQVVVSNHSADDGEENIFISVGLT